MREAFVLLVLVPFVAALITEVRDVPPIFTGIYLAGPFDVIVEVGAAQPGLTIECDLGDRDLVNAILTDVEETSLKIRIAAPYTDDEQLKGQIRIYVKGSENVNAFTSATDVGQISVVSSVMKARAVTAITQKNGPIDLGEVQTVTVAVTTYKGGWVRVFGKTANGHFTAYKDGTIDARDLWGRIVVAAAYGSGDIYCSASTRFSASTKKDGRILYRAGKSLLGKDLVVIAAVHGTGAIEKVTEF